MCGTVSGQIPYFVGETASFVGEITDDVELSPTFVEGIWTFVGEMTRFVG